MRYLLDTHALLWFLGDDNRLSESAMIAIMNPANQVFVSDVSFFEVAIKLTLNKLKIARPLASFINQTISQKFRILPIRHEHIITYQQVQIYESHRDPFDRMLIATALHEQLDIITIDEKFDGYQHIIRRVW